MKHISITLALLMMLCSPVAAQDFDKGLAAAKAGDFESAIKQWRPLAEAGDYQTQFLIGIFYSEGKGVEQNYIEAVKWYLASSNQGFHEAQHNLANMYFDGRGAMCRPKILP